MSNQGDKIASLQAALGAGFEDHPYEGLWHAYWDDQSVAGTNFDERMLNWINGALGTSYTNLPGAMQAYAVSRGYYNWDSMGDLSLITFEVGDALLQEIGDFLLQENGDKILIDF